MAVTVEDILKLKCMDGAELVAGKSGLENNVLNTTIMDVSDITKWLHGGEVLFGAELLFKKISKDFIVNLKRKNVSAIVTKPNYAVKFDTNLKELCDSVKLPLITINSKNSWVDITYPITRLIVNQQFEAIYESQLFHSNLMKCIIHEQSLNELCDDVYEISGIEIAILDKDFQINGASHSKAWNDLLFDFSLSDCIYNSSLKTNINGDETGGYIFENSKLRNLSMHAYVFPVVQSERTYSYIMILEDKNTKSLDISTSIKIDQLTLIISLLEIQQLEVMNANRRHNNLFLDILIDGKYTNNYQRLAIKNFKHNIFEDSFFIVTAYIEKLYNHDDYVEYNFQLSQLFEKIETDETILRGALCFDRGENIVFIIPAKNKKPKEIINFLYNFCKGFLKMEDIFFGVSGPTKVEHFPKTFEQSLQTLNYARLHYNKKCLFYNDLGIMRFFIEQNGSLNQQMLIEIREKYIQPLVKYDTNHQTELEKTLRILIECNGSKKEASEKLFIHRNTLNVRLSKIEKIIGCDLNNSEDRFTIQLALKLSDSLRLHDTQI